MGGLQSWQKKYRPTYNPSWSHIIDKVDGVSVLDIETVSFTDAIGRVLAEDVVAKDPLPPFPASIKVKKLHSNFGGVKTFTNNNHFNL